MSARAWLRTPLIASVLLSLPIASGCSKAEEEHAGAHGPKVYVGRARPAPAVPEGIDSAALRERAKKLVGALPANFYKGGEPSAAMIDLGRQLYYDTRLSLADDVACNTCHLLDEFGVDGQPTSTGHEGQTGERNSPTVYNAAGQLAQFWDGRAADVEEQAKGPVLNPVEMAMPNEAAVVAKLSKIPGYVEAFAAAFPEAEDALTYDHMADAIGAFERGLTTPAPIDAWLTGDDEALSEEQLEGLALFLDTDCTSCHNGFGFGGASYQKLGTEKPWPGLKDVGRSAITGDPRDEFVFKVPSLRNVEKTGPYLHDGSIEELSQMVAKMVTHQTKRETPFSDEEMASMLAFLGALTGELPTDYIAEPELPANPAKPPEPEPEPEPEPG
jgi:cytochrome c peroxidase